MGDVTPLISQRSTSELLSNDLIAGAATSLLARVRSSPAHRTRCHARCNVSCMCTGGPSDASHIHSNTGISGSKSVRCMGSYSRLSELEIN
jgi:hypothetical protein